MTDTTAQNPTQNPAGKKTSIMFVDDDKFLLDMYALKFTNSGYEVRVAQGPEDALKQLKDTGLPPPNILLMDVVMPGMDGLQLLEAIRKENLAQGSVVIMLTNQGMTEDIAKAKKLNVDGYIIKAMTIPSEVLSEVNKIYAGIKNK